MFDQNAFDKAFKRRDRDFKEGWAGKLNSRH